MSREMSAEGMRAKGNILERIDRRIIFLFVAVSLALPLLFNVPLPPSPMKTAEQFYAAIEALDPAEGRIVFFAVDWGPGTLAENKPQTELAIEHLMRKRIPFALISIYPLAKPFMVQIPRAVAKRLAEETGEKWEYGVDWVNFGFRQGRSIMIQGLAKSRDLHDTLQKDVNSTPVSDIPLMEKVRTIRDVSMLIEVTGLVGAVNSWLQYFQADSYRPPMLHGCTSITIPEAYIFYASKQLLGFFEGIAGAAWYETLLQREFSDRDDVNAAISVNTGLSYAHLLIIGLIALGNIGLLASYLGREK